MNVNPPLFWTTLLLLFLLLILSKQTHGDGSCFKLILACRSQFDFYCVQNDAGSKICGRPCELAKQRNCQDNSGIKNGKCSERFRVMTLNCWEGGSKVDNASAKLLQTIEQFNPDILLLQEVIQTGPESELIQFLESKLKMKGWNFVYQLIPDALLANLNVIITRWNVSGKYPALFSKGVISRQLAVGCELNMKNKSFHVWNVHMTNENYGPYVACGLGLSGRKTTRCNGAAAADNFRMQNLSKILDNEYFKKSLANIVSVPVILGGDFNSPSHLDWTPQTSALHCNCSAVAWPVTTSLQKRGFRDTFRELYPNPAGNLGFTWSPVDKEEQGQPEPQDRIDYIFYQGNLRAVAATTTSGRGLLRQIPFQAKNDWISDHAAVLVDFMLC